VRIFTPDGHDFDELHEAHRMMIELFDRLDEAPDHGEELFEQFIPLLRRLVAIYCDKPVDPWDFFRTRSRLQIWGRADRLLPPDLAALPDDDFQEFCKDFLRLVRGFRKIVLWDHRRRMAIHRLRE